jgi:hypothetical protein
MHVNGLCKWPVYVHRASFSVSSCLVVAAFTQSRPRKYSHSGIVATSLRSHRDQTSRLIARPNLAYNTTLSSFICCSQSSADVERDERSDSIAAWSFSRRRNACESERCMNVSPILYLGVSCKIRDGGGGECFERTGPVLPRQLALILWTDRPVPLSLAKCNIK